MKKFIKKKKFIGILIVLFLAACSQALNIYSDNDDVQFGMQFDKEIRNNPKEYPIYKKNPAVRDYIDKRIFQEIINSPEVKKKQTYKYQLEIVDNDSILNAFALPGGFVYVYTGLLKYLDSEAALAGVLGHEIAHAERRHATQRITKAYGIQILSSLVLGENPSQTAQIVSNLFSGLALLANSRSDEAESDQYSLKYLQSTRFYPGSVKFFFEKLRDDGKVAKGGQGIALFLSTHPDPISRIDETNKRLQQANIEIKDYKAIGNGIFKDEYRKNILEPLLRN
jgi:predicted Zn-dependent protease